MSETAEHEVANVDELDDSAERGELTEAEREARARALV